MNSSINHKKLKKCGFLWLYSWILSLKTSEIITVNEKDLWLKELNEIKQIIFNHNDEFIKNKLSYFIFDNPKLHFMINNLKSRRLEEILQITKQIYFMDLILPSDILISESLNYDKNNKRTNQESEKQNKKMKL